VGRLSAAEALLWIAKHSAQLVERRTGWPRETWYQVILPSGPCSQGRTPTDAVNAMATHLRAQQATEQCTNETRWYHALIGR